MIATAAEREAHVRLQSIADRRRMLPGHVYRSSGRKLRSGVADRNFLLQQEAPLRTFLPRCPFCADVLDRQDEPGRCLLSCSCGWRAVEMSL